MYVDNRFCYTNLFSMWRKELLTIVLFDSIIMTNFGGTMIKNKYRLNIFLIFVISSLILVILFIDSDTLNSLYISYEDFVINEINIGAEETSVVYNEVSVNMVSNNVNKWVWPTNSNYIISSYFGYRWGSMHNAIDISGTGYGSNIYAANSGKVVTAKGGCVSGNLSCNGRAGNYIVIRHNVGNYYTVYMHLKDIRVSEGQTVGSGQVIGTMGNTGNVVPAPTTSNPYSGTHLHFALYIGEPYKGGYAVNPMRLY